MMQPLYSEHDAYCPIDFVPYKDKCLNPNVIKLSYEDAMVIDTLSIVKNVKFNAICISETLCRKRVNYYAN